MTLMLLALLLPSVCIVNAFRETHAGERSSFWKRCRSTKCNSKTYHLKGDFSGEIQFQDCEVNVNKPFYTDSNVRMCEERCKVVHSGEAKTVKVERKSDSDEESCALVEGICQDSCCKAKCSGESYDLKGDLGGQVQFQECEAGSVKSFWSGSRLVA
eukprot:Skav216635  [mRNA]  locus=scaffold1255:145294:146115:+ [translate_table: standard]